MPESPIHPSCARSDPLAFSFSLTTRLRLPILARSSGSTDHDASRPPTQHQAPAANTRRAQSPAISTPIGAASRRRSIHHRTPILNFRREITSFSIPPRRGPQGESATMSGAADYQEMAASLPPSLKAIPLTHVRYRRGDPLGLFLAWVSLVPVFISLGGFVSHFLFRRELQGLCFAAGLLVSQVLNELIKDSVAQSRPAYCELLEACDSHGWPSSHSQYMFFFATYLSLLSLRRSRARQVIAAVPWPLAFLTMLSRVYLGYHTVAQVRAPEFRIRSD